MFHLKAFRKCKVQGKCKSDEDDKILAIVSAKSGGGAKSAEIIGRIFAANQRAQ